MKYDDLLCSHKKHGTSEEHILIRNGYTDILENVVIAPWWTHNMFDNVDILAKDMIIKAIIKQYEQI